MKKFYVVLVSLLSVLLLFSACTIENYDELSCAINKTDELKSFSFNANIISDIKVSGLPDDLLENVSEEELNEIYNSILISFNGRLLMDEETDRFSSELFMSFSAFANSIKFGTWERYTEDGMFTETITQNPTFTGIENPEDKKYTVTTTPVEEVSDEYTELITQVCNDFIAECAKDAQFVTWVDNKHYKLHVDKQKCVKFIEDAINIYAESDLSSQLESSPELSVTALKEKIVQVYSVLIGEKGIDIELFIGDEGYISEAIITLDLNIDLNELAKIITDSEADETDAKVNIKLELDLEIYDYNSQEEIDFPEVNEDNAYFIDKADL